VIVRMRRDKIERGSGAGLPDRRGRGLIPGRALQVED
jgi:hypothetical protein